MSWIETAIEVPPPYAALVACVLLAAGLAALVARKPRVHSTTLLAAWRWSLASLLCIALGEASIGLAPGVWTASWAASLRFAAAMTTFCPIMALLGAKRPQHRPWQFIVLSLWVILSLPSLEWLLFSGMREIHAARFWFLMALTLLGAGNGLATRFWLAGLLVALGQIAMVSPFCAATQSLLPGALAPLLGLLLMVAGWSLIALARPRPRQSVASLNRVWLDFRDAFGAVWSLRVAERINASASMCAWPVRLGWYGFRAQEQDICSEAPPVAAAALRTLLRRFVSPEWIDERLADSGPVTGASTADSRAPREQTAAL